MSQPNLATKLDPNIWAAASSKYGRSSVASSATGRSAKGSTKTRGQLISEVLGDPVPKRVIRDGNLSWTSQKSEGSTSSTRTENRPSLAKEGVGSDRHEWTSSSTDVQSSIQPPPSVADSHSSRVQLPSESVKGSPRNSVKEDSWCPCSFDGCKRGFRNVKELRKHKDKEHDYCKVCDIDFEDDEAFHKHKILSDRHITCAICSLDFKSESGRDRHYHQVCRHVDNQELAKLHSSAHNVKCKGCNVVFQKGSALLAHFEKNLCRPTDREGVSASRFETQRAAMAMAMQTLEKEKGEEDSRAATELNAPGGMGGSVANSSVGGVPIELSEQPDFLTDNEYKNHSIAFPLLSSHGTGRPPSPADSEASTNLLSFDDNRTALNASNLAELNRKNLGGDQTTPKASAAEWPTLGKNEWPALGKAANHDDLVQEMAKTRLQKPEMSPGISAPPSVQPSHTGFSLIDGSGLPAVELQPNAVSGMWECPYYKCG
ncbi:MAG: hypothetical protein Q9222_003022, partial [Ikaeria aurantiellina]